MIEKQKHIAASGILALMVISGPAWSLCINNLDGTGATSVLSARGQGNFSCADMSPGPDGGTMVNITSSVSLIFSDGNKAVDIVVPDNLLPNKEIDAVFINASGNGERCLYTFSNYSALADGLRRNNESFTTSSITVCADGIGKVPEPEPEVIEPISTAADACSAEFTVTNADGATQERLDDLDAAVAFSRGGTDLAVCNTDGSAQVECVNLCNDFQSPAEDPASRCPGTSDEFGQVPLSCRPCALTDLAAPPARDREGNPLFYCWEYENSVVRDPALDRNIYPKAPGTLYVPGTSDTVFRTPGTMLPHKPAGSSVVGIKSFNACKTTYINGRSYTKCF